MRHNANVYIRRDGAHAIITSVHENQDGVWCEDETPSPLQGPLDPTRLGEETATAAPRARRINRDIREGKLTDWPVYRASGSASVRRFEEDFICLNVTAANDGNLIYEITGHVAKDHPLRVTASISRYAPASELGALLLHVYRSCRDRVV